MADSTPTIARDEGRDALVLHAPYDEAFVADLKASLTERAWDATRNVWLVRGVRAGALSRIVLRHFPSVLLLGAGPRGRT
jgi:hypothetical protein